MFFHLKEPHIKLLEESNFDNFYKQDEDLMTEDTRKNKSFLCGFDP